MVGLASVILKLLIRLISPLRCEKIWTRAEIILPRAQTGRIIANRQLQRRSWIQNTASSHRICDSIAEFGVSDANAVSVASGGEVQPYSMHRCVIIICKRLERVGNETGHAAVLIKRKAVEQSRRTLELIIQAPNRLSLSKRRIEISRKRSKLISRKHRCRQVLLGAFPIQKKEQSIFNHRPAEAAPKLIPLERVVLASRKSCRHAAVAEIIETLAVPIIRPRSRDHIHRA